MNPYLVIVGLLAWIASAGGAFLYGQHVEHVESVAAAETEAARVRDQADVRAIEHQTELNELNSQLGDARERLATLTTGRDCLSPAAVGVLNRTGVPRAASQPARAASAAATDRDVGNALAQCRASYAKVSDQLNAILDIEDKR